MNTCDSVGSRHAAPSWRALSLFAAIVLSGAGAAAVAGPFSAYKAEVAGAWTVEAPPADVGAATLDEAPVDEFSKGLFGSGNRDASPPEVPQVLAPTLINLSDELANLSARGMNSVVSISVERAMAAPPNPFGFSMRQGEQVQRGQGSGVIVDAQGLILTNHHVVQGADSVQVSMADGAQFAATVVGSDAATDVAVVRLDNPPDDLQALPFGDSDAVRPGQLTMAIGNPFGLAGSVSLGIVSAIGRDRMGITDYEDFIQTDTAINPGNSGGALIDMHGNLVGINTAIFSRSGGSQGIGFAVPSNMANRVMNQLIEHGTVTRGWLGVGIGEVPEKVAAALGIDANHGVLISSVDPNGPAARAGLRDGDVVLSIDGAPMDDVDALRYRVAEMAPGSRPNVDVVNGEGRTTLRVELGERPVTPQRVARQRR